MSTHAQATFEITGWEEDPYTEIEGERKLTRASVKQGFSGDLAGEASVEWLMCYREDKTADFAGLQRFVGTLGDRDGSFVMTTQGTFDGEKAAGPLKIVDGSGTGELTGISGVGAFTAPHGGTPSFELEYDVA